MRRPLRARALAASLALPLVVAAMVVSGGAPASAAPAGFTIHTSALTAPRGMAADSTDNVYWVADSDSQEIYAVTASGSAAGSVPLAFTPTDIEALQFHAGQLYIGDIGDPKGSRPYITVYRLNALNFGHTGGYHAWDFAYPDGKHDAAAMMVSPRGNIYIVTRGASAGIYRAPATPSTSGVNTLIRVGNAPAWVTDGTFVGSDKVALRTFTSLYVVNAFTWATTAAAELPRQSDGQALTTALGSSGKLVAVGGTTADDVAVPTTLASVAPAPSVAPKVSGASASATTSASVAAAVSPDAGGSTASSRTGSLVALVAAAIAGLLAGGVVAFKR